MNTGLLLERPAPAALMAARDGLGSERVLDIQRARVLAAMIETCREHGPSDVTVGHVVSRAGVSRRTFYELFRDRGECFLAAFDDAVARASQYVLAVYQPGTRWTERVRDSLVALLSFLDAEPDTAWLLVVGSLGARVAVLERRERVLTQMIAVVDEGRVYAKARSQPSPLLAEGIVGGVIAVLHARLVAAKPGRLLDLTGSLMGMIVLPYLGASAARRELQRPLPAIKGLPAAVPADPLRDVEMRLTYRTVRVLMSVAENPGSCNREIGSIADIHDQGQISKLLSRLHKLGLVENSDAGQERGAPNAWLLTSKGREVQSAIAQRMSQA